MQPMHWRGIFDDKGRVMVAISYNSDLGDAWEWADAPHYPEKFSGLAIRIGVNYVVYAIDALSVGLADAITLRAHRSLTAAAQRRESKLAR